MSPAALLRLNPLFKDVNYCRNMVFFKCSMVRLFVMSVLHIILLAWAKGFNLDYNEFLWADFFSFNLQKATTDCCAAAQLHEILELRSGAKRVKKSIGPPGTVRTMAV